MAGKDGQAPVGSHYHGGVRVHEKNRARELQEAEVEERAPLRVAVADIPEQGGRPLPEVEGRVLSVVDGTPGARPQLLETRVAPDVYLQYKIIE